MSPGGVKRRKYLRRGQSRAEHLRSCIATRNGAELFWRQIILPPSDPLFLPKGEEPRQRLFAQSCRDARTQARASPLQRAGPRVPKQKNPSYEQKPQCTPGPQPRMKPGRPLRHAAIVLHPRALAQPSSTPEVASATLRQDDSPDMSRREQPTARQQSAPPAPAPPPSLRQAMHCQSPPAKHPNPPG